MPPPPTTPSITNQRWIVPRKSPRKRMLRDRHPSFPQHNPPIPPPHFCFQRLDCAMNLAELLASVMRYCHRHPPTPPGCLTAGVAVELAAISAANSRSASHIRDLLAWLLAQHGIQLLRRGGRLPMLDAATGVPQEHDSGTR